MTAVATRDSALMTKPPSLRRSAFLALLVSLVCIPLGHFLLIRYVHEGGPLLWLSQLFLMPDLLVSSLVTQDVRSRLWVLVVLMNFVYVWVVIHFSWWGIRAIEHRRNQA